MPVSTAEQRQVYSSLLGANTIITLLALGSVIVGVITLIILSLSNDTLEGLVDDYGFQMSTECDDLNPCTWDLMQGAGSHCANVNVKNGLNCSDVCLVEGTGACQLDSKANPFSCCVGECAGQCDDDDDCPDLLLDPALSVPVSTTCFLKTCIYAAFDMESVFSGGLIGAALPDQLNDVYDTRCASIITGNNTGCVRSDWYNFDFLLDDFCLFSYNCANYQYTITLINQLNGTEELDVPVWVTTLNSTRHDGPSFLA